MTPKVSVVVATYQRRDRLERCLAAIHDQVLGDGDVEVIVVDNGSSDGSAELLRRWTESAPEVVALRIEENHGAAPARNLGLSRATAPIVAFTDDDCVPAPTWLERGLEAMADPEVVVAQGKTVPDPAEPLGRWALSQSVTELTWLFETCNVFYRREALIAAGGFDEGLGWFGEDTVAGWRVLRGGGRAVFAPEAEVVHAVTHPGFRAFLRRARSYRNWPAVVRSCPELRDEALYRRWFLRPRSAQSLALALGAGIVAGGWSRRHPATVAMGAVLALPYLSGRAPRSLVPEAWVDAVLATVFDLAVEAALVEGSVRHRTVVL